MHVDLSSYAGSAGGESPGAGVAPTAASAGFTVLRSVSGRLATKRFSATRDGRVRKSGFGNERFFTLEPVEVGTIVELTALLQRLEREPCAFIVRGAPLPHADLRGSRRLLHRDPATGDAPTIEAADRCWVMIDLDGVVCPVGLDPRVAEDADELIDFLTGLLPAEFQDASCFWQWSASQSVPDKLTSDPPDHLRAHLFFWLDRAVPDTALRAWATTLKRGGLPIDPAVFAPVQPHYTAAPVFDGIPDPLSRRSGFRKQLVDVVPLVLPPAAKPSPANDHAVRAYDGSGLDFHLSRIGPEGYQEPIKATIAAFVARYGPDADDDVLKAEIRARIAEVSSDYPRGVHELERYRSDRFLDGKIAWTRDRERAAATPPKSASLPPYFGEEGADRDGVLAEQSATIRQWLARNHRIVQARREIERRRQSAFAEAGFAEDSLGAGRESKEARRRKAAISRRLRRQVLEEFGLGTLSRQGERMLITGAQGTGKSRTVAKGIAEMRGAVVVHWHVPTLKKAFEQALEYSRLAGPDSLPVRVVSGRGAANPDDPQTAMCPRHKVVNRAAAMGVEVQKEICESCALKDTCGYQRQREQLGAAAESGGLFITSADYLWLPCPAPHADIVVVDESIVGRATETVSFDPRRLTEDDKWAGADLGAAMRHRGVAAVVRQALTEHRARELEFLRNQRVTLDDLKAALKHLASREDAQPKVHGRMTDQAIARALDAVEVRETRKVLILLRQIRREFEQPRARLNTVWFEPEWRVVIDGEVSFEPRVFVGYIRAHRLAQSTPALALDGTGSLELNRKVFGAQMVERRFPVPRNAEVIQVRGKVFSRQSLTGASKNGNPISSPATAERLRDDVLALLRLLPGDVLLVTYKAVEELLQPRLPSNVRIAHFGAVRGLNTYEVCETVVVLGRQQPSAQKLEAQTRPFAADDRESLFPFGGYVQQCRARRLHDRSASIELVQVHPDRRCQELLEQIREAEIVQAIDRVRPVFHRRRIIVLTSLALDITVDRVVPWAELRPDKFVTAYARHGVLPLSAVDLSQAFPDLWSTAKEAQNALSYRSRNTLKTPNNISIWRIQGVFPDPLEAKYRRANQRGPMARALVRSDISNPRAVLQALVGELAEFDVERPPASPLERPMRPLRLLGPLASALSAESRLLSSLPSDARPPDALGTARVIRLMALAPDPAGAERAAVA